MSAPYLDYYEGHRLLSDDMSSETLGLTLLGILTFLVVATIFFERTQEWMIESSVETMKPVACFFLPLTLLVMRALTST